MLHHLPFALKKVCTLLFLALLTVVPQHLSAQATYESQDTDSPESWEELWQELLTDEDSDEDDQNDTYERLFHLVSNPLNLNTATREELEQLPFLSELQVMDILEYRQRYGPVRSLRELKMVQSLDHKQIQLLPFFLYVESGEGEGVRERNESSNPSSLNPHSELTLSGRVPFYDRHGDRDGYLGYKYRHSIRYEYSKGDKLRIGILGSQDSGEPFFANSNKWGYDNYSYYVMVGKMGVLNKAIVGKYRLSAGMGLVLGSSFSLGKLYSLQTMGRQPTTLRPNSSRSLSDYFRGAAVTLGFLQKGQQGDAPLAVTVFGSYRNIDATLSDEGTVTTIVTNGYHRTVSEMNRKDNTHLTAFGGRIAYTNQGWRAGLNAVTTHSDRELRPSTALYHRHSPSGNNFFNASLDYNYTRPHLTIGGETAINQSGGLATVNKIGWQPSGNIGIMALWRFYSYRYSGLYSHSFGDNTTAQNESGLFIGTTWRPIRRMTVMAYADYAYFPWAKYLVSQSSRAYDFMLQAEYRLKRWKLSARGRVRLRERDDEDKTALTANNEYRGRFFATYSIGKKWSTRTQLDVSRTYYLKASHGWMMSELLTFQDKSWLMCATAAFFHTDDYSSRIFLYERQLAHEFHLPSYYGEGIRLAATMRKDFGKRLRLTARIGYTNYFDRATIGTGLQQTYGSHTTDLDLQLRYRLF